MTGFKPFSNEIDEQEIGKLKIENRVDRVSVYGSLDLTCDQAGLANARILKTLVDAIVSSLESQSLPEALPAPPVKTVKNPF